MAEPSWRDYCETDPGHHMRELTSQNVFLRTDPSSSWSTSSVYFTESSMLLLTNVRAFRLAMTLGPSTSPRTIIATHIQ